MDAIKETMKDLLKRIQQKCGDAGNNGEDIFFLAAALKEIDSVRAALPKGFLDS